MPPNLDDVDLNDLESFAQGTPHETFARLRREDPVRWQARPAGMEYWAVTRHADVLAVLRDAATFSSALHGTMIYDEPDFRDRPALMIQMDPPRHTRYRALVSPAFTPSMIARLEPFVRERAAAIVDRALAKRECDFALDVAAELPSQVIAELLGVPEVDRAHVVGLADRIMAFADPDFGGAGGPALEAIDAMHAYAGEFGRKRRETPGDDIASELLTAELEGQTLSEDDFIQFFRLLFVGGAESTRSAIAGGVVALTEHPEQWERLGKERSLMATAVEEIIRWTNPFHYVRRTATRDTELRGQKLRRGDRVVLWLGSANRDEEVFEHPARFDVGRKPNEHLSFGNGRHLCLAANLARLEVRVALEALLDREVRVEMMAPPLRVRSNFINAIKRMPVRLHSS